MILKIIHDKTIDAKITQAEIIAALPYDPPTTIRDVLAALCSAKLVISYRGTGGGYLLVQRPSEISLYHVATAVEMGIPMSRSSQAGYLERFLIRALSEIRLSSFVIEAGVAPDILE